MAKVLNAFELIRGPQDGARIHSTADPMPQAIYVGSKWAGDAVAAWSRDRCSRFPCRYVLEAGRFVYHPEYYDEPWKLSNGT